NPERGDRKNSAQPSHQRVGEAQIGPLHADDAQPDDAAAESGSAPGPEGDVIRDEHKREPTVVAREIEEVDGNRDEDRVDGKRCDRSEEQPSWVYGGGS